MTPSSSSTSVSSRSNDAPGRVEHARLGKIPDWVAWFLRVLEHFCGQVGLPSKYAYMCARRIARVDQIALASAQLSESNPARALDECSHVGDCARRAHPEADGLQTRAACRMSTFFRARGLSRGGLRLPSQPSPSSRVYGPCESIPSQPLTVDIVVSKRPVLEKCIAQLCGRIFDRLRWEHPFSVCTCAPADETRAGHQRTVGQLAGLPLWVWPASLGWCRSAGRFTLS